MKPTIKLFAMALLATSVLSSCGSSGDKANAGSDTEEANIEDNKAMTDKMNVYVDAVNKVNAPLNKGYNYYLKYVNEETGAATTPGGDVYFMPEINDANNVLDAVSAAASKEPKADIDALAADYVIKAKAVLALHNDLAKYYGTKTNLTDKNAHGLETHKAYISAMQAFKPVGKQLSDAYDKYYKEGNVKYMAKLEKKGDMVRLYANKLMNAAEPLQKDFYNAIPDGKLTMSPELETIMQQTATFQTDLDAFSKAVESQSPEQQKKFFRPGTTHSLFKGAAERFLTDLRSAIDYIKKGEPGSAEHYYTSVGQSYDNMINYFNSSGY